MSTHRNTIGRNSVFAIFALGTVLFSSFSAIMYGYFESANRAHSDTLHTYEVLRINRRILVDLIDMETGVRGYLLTADERYLSPYNDSKKLYPKEIAELNGLLEGYPQERLHTERWLANAADVRSALDAQVANFRKSRRIDIQALEYQRQQMGLLRDYYEQNIAATREKLVAQTHELAQKRTSFLLALITGTVTAIIAMFLAALTIHRLDRRTRHAQQQLDAHETRLQAALNGIGDGVFEYHPQTNRLYLSAPFKSMLGYSDAEFPSTVDRLNSLVHPDDLAAMWNMFERYSNQEIPSLLNIYRMLHRDGSWRWIMTRGVGFWDENGVLTRLVGTHADITDQKIHEEELKQVNSDLETFTFIASHDLRSPLVNLKGFAKELELSVNRVRPLIESHIHQFSDEEKTVLDESLNQDIPEALRFIESSTARMDTLTTAVLDLSRIGKRQYQFELVDVDAIVRKCLDAQHYEISKAGVTIQCDALPAIVSDALAIEQVLSNLIDNAIKYLDPSRPGVLTIGAHARPTEITYHITDNGRGIQEDDAAKIFQMFRRARNAGNVRGTGMGMSFVRATLRKVGGHIWYESTVGSGTTFYIKLPRRNLKGEAL